MRSNFGISGFSRIAHVKKCFKTFIQAILPPFFPQIFVFSRDCELREEKLYNEVLKLSPEKREEAMPLLEPYTSHFERQVLWYGLDYESASLYSQGMKNSSPHVENYRWVVMGLTKGRNELIWAMTSYEEFHLANDYKHLSAEQSINMHKILIA